MRTRSGNARGSARRARTSGSVAIIPENQRERLNPPSGAGSAGHRTPDAVSVKLKICLVGDEGVGKTSLVRRFVLSEFDERYLRTVGVVVYKRVVFLGPIAGTTYAANLTVWDVLGGLGFQGRYGDAYLASASGVLAVCDLTRPDSLDDLGLYLERTAAVGGVPAIVLANKIDLGPHVRITGSELTRFCARYGATFLETSAKTGQNVGAAFSKLAETALKVILAESPRAIGPEAD